MAKKNNEKDLDALESIEKAGANNVEENFQSTDNKPKLIDGYNIIDNYDLPQHGVLYPESWRFAYRCPTAKEVANFSTINEQDQPAIVAAVEDLIRKCVIIYDADTEKQITAGQICDCHRTFFMLKLRDFYIPNSPIQYESICKMCKEPLEVNITAESLEFAKLNDKLISAFDGRKFTLEFPDKEETISFLVPTIDITGRIFKYLVNAYRNEKNDKEAKSELKVLHNKQFLLLAPFMYEKGTETVKEIIAKFSRVEKNENLFACYLDIANKIKLDNLNNINVTCTCGSEEETTLRFPGGWKSMFVTKDDTGYFD